MAYTRDDFKVYGANPKVDMHELDNPGSLHHYKERSFFEYEKENDDPFLRRFRWIRLGESVDDETEILIDTVLDIRDHKSEGELEQHDLKMFVEKEYPEKLKDTSVAGSLMGSVTIERSRSMFRDYTHAFFDVVDDDIVIRIVGVNKALVRSNTAVSRYEVVNSVYDILFMTVRKRPVVYAFDVEKQEFVKTTKAQALNGLGDDIKTVERINNMFDFCVFGTIVNGDDTEDSFKKAMEAQGDYVKHKDLISFIILPPFFSKEAIDGSLAYKMESSLEELYGQAITLFDLLDTEMNNRSVIEMITDLGFYLNIESFKSILGDLDIKEIDPESSIADLIGVDHYLVENLAFYVNYNYIDKIKTTEKADTFLSLLRRSKELLNFGIDIDIIVDNFDKMHSLIAYNLEVLFNNDLYRHLTTLYKMNGYSEKELKNDVLTRIMEASELRCIEMPVISRMYSRLSFEIFIDGRNNESRDEFFKLNYREAFEYLLPIDVQYALNKLGFYGSGF